MNVRRVIGMLLLGLGTACSSTYQMRQVETSGFLGDYSSLHKGKEGEPALFYVNDRADICSYNRILIDPVVAYLGEKSGLESISRNDRQALLNYFYAALREQLGKDYEITDQPGPGVLELRVAMTDARSSKVMMDTLSSVVPVGLAVSALERVALGRTMTAGAVRIEAEVLDPLTGIRLGAMVDERSGTKFSGKLDKWSKWQDARDGLDYWANRLRSVLQECRKRRCGDGKDTDGAVSP